MGCTYGYAKKLIFMYMEEILGDSALIIGFGREGKSAYAWLRRHYPAMKIDVADAKIADHDAASPVYAGTVFHTGDTYLSSLPMYSTIIRSPGVSPYFSEMKAYVKQGGHVTSATNIFFSQVKGKTIGVTGTKGKSTTTSLIAHILSSQYADVRCVGNIGVPMLDALDSSDDNTVFAIELSSHQLVDCRYSPKIAVFLNIVPEHLDYYPDFGMYSGAKANITLHQSPQDMLVYNPEHLSLRRYVENTHAKRIHYGESCEDNSKACLRDGMLMVAAGKEYKGVISSQEVPLLGNTENILAATAVASVFDIPSVNIKERIASFSPLPHRLERVGVYRGITFYNDSLSTIPQATVHALRSLRGNVATLIAGGYDRHIDYKDLGAYLSKYPIKTLIVFPDTGVRIWECIDRDAQKLMSRYDVSSMEEAVKCAYDHTPEGSICVMSPGSASYNMFRDYADRGEQFKSWIKKLG